MTTIGIVVAMLPEASCLMESPPRPGVSVTIRPGMILHVCGIGPKRAAQGAEQLIAEGVAGLMSFGTAGALVPGLTPGAILIPEQVETAAGPLPTHPGWRIHARECLTAAGISIACGNMADADTVVSTSAQKAALGAQRNAAAVDMESAAVLRIAAQSALPSLVMRVIVDPLTMELPAFLLKRSDIYGRADLPGILLDLMWAPTRLPALMKLSRAFSTATTTMRGVGRHLHDLHPGHDALARPR